MKEGGGVRLAEAMDLEKGKPDEYGTRQFACDVRFMEELNRFAASGSIKLELPTKFVIPRHMKLSKPCAYTPKGGLVLGLNWRMCGRESEEGRIVTDLKARWAIAYLIRRRRRRYNDGGSRGTANLDTDSPKRSARCGGTANTRNACVHAVAKRPWSGKLEDTSSPLSVITEWGDFVRAVGITFPRDLEWYELGFDYVPYQHTDKLQNLLATDALFVALFLLHKAGCLEAEEEFTILTKDPQFHYRSFYFWNDLFLLENQIPWRIVEAVIADFCSPFTSEAYCKKALHVALESRIRALFPPSDNEFHKPAPFNKQLQVSAGGLLDLLEKSYENVDSKKPCHLLDYLLLFICLDPTGWAKTWTIIPTSVHEAKRCPYSSISFNCPFQIPSAADLGNAITRENLIRLFLAQKHAGYFREEFTKEILARLDTNFPAAFQSTTTTTPAQGDEEDQRTTIPQLQVGVDQRTWPPEYDDSVPRFADDEGPRKSSHHDDGLTVQALPDITQLHGSQQEYRKLHRDLEGIGVWKRKRFVRFHLALLTLLLTPLFSLTSLWIYLGKVFMWIGRRVPIQRLILLDITRCRASSGEPWRWNIARFDFARTTNTRSGEEWHGLYYYDDKECYFNPLRVLSLGEWLKEYVLFLYVGIFSKEVLTVALRKVKDNEEEEMREKRCALVMAYFQERAAVMRRLHQELHPCHPVHIFLKYLCPDTYWKKVQECKGWAAMVQVLLEAVAARRPVDLRYAKAIVQALPDEFKNERKRNGWPVVFIDSVELRGNLAPEDNWRVESATALAARGVKVGGCNNLLQVNMEFSPTECLRLPQVHVHPVTESLLRNLAAWERIKDDKEMPLASYIKLMDNLIVTEDDVVIMKEARVIDHHLASDKAVANLWNDLSVELLFRPSNRWAGVIRKVNHKSESSWRKMRTEFILTYFSSPWTFIALVATSLLLLLTIAQTIIAAIQI